VPAGLRELAERNVEIAHYAADRLASAGLKRRFAGPFFNEFAVELGSVRNALEAAHRRGLLAGVPLGRDYPELEGALLICATEMNEPADIDLLCETLREGA